MPKTITLSLSILSPTSIGGFDTHVERPVLGQRNLVIREPFRATELKCKWRWWLKALVGGALWHRGVTGSELKKVTVQITNYILGSTKRKSAFAIKISPQEYLRVMGNAYEKLRGAGRVSIMIRGKKVRLTLDPEQGQIEYRERVNINAMFYSRGKFKIDVMEIRNDIDPLEEALAILSLILSILLDGIGKMSSRGFGALQIEGVEGDINLLPKEASDILNNLKLIVKEDANRVRDFIRNLIETLEKIADQVVEERGYYSLSAPETIPEIEVVRSNAEIPCFRCLVKESETNDILKVIYDICSITKRAYRYSYSNLYRSEKPGDLAYPQSVKTNLADFLGLYWKWLLGLPRTARNTGYVQAKLGKEKIERRCSAIKFSILKTMITKPIVTVSIFYSSDWPNHIKWTNNYGDVEQFNPVELLKQYITDLNNELINFLRKGGFQLVI